MLSVPETDDVDAIVAAVQDPDVTRWTTLPFPYERRNGEEFVTAAHDRWAAGTDAVWAIRRVHARAGDGATDDGAARNGAARHVDDDRAHADDASAFVGVIGLHKIDTAWEHAGGSAEIGFWMAPEGRGSGLLTEAARAVIDWAFSDDGHALRRIEWRAVVGNVPSARSARALGFRYEGILRQAAANPRGRHDGWVAGLLPTDDRSPVAWPVLD